MHAPIEITFRGMASSPAVEAQVERWAGRLERSYDRIHRCAVTIEQPHRSHRSGRTFQVRVEIDVPEHRIVVSHDDGRARVAVADAFQAARRRLQDHARIRRGDVKQHA